LHRSTRKLTLTPEGEHYYGEVRNILDAVAEAEFNARGIDKPKGLLRLACPTSLGRVLLPRVQTLLERYPELEVDLQISDRYVDLVEEGLDLAIRIGALTDSSLRARTIGVSERVCVASPDYLSQNGTPHHPTELANHNCITYTLSVEGDHWPFRDGEVAVNGRFRVNTTDGIFSAAAGGLGICYGPLWLFEDALSKHQLQLVLEDYVVASAPINVIYSAKRLLPRRAIVFMDFIADEFSRISLMQDGALERLQNLIDRRRKSNAKRNESIVTRGRTSRT
jgi:LysR family transcriptional regulator, regulator for bpeEF and oprC